MKFFLDTTDIEEIRELNEYGLVDGITTNPTLIRQSGRDFKDVILSICEIVDGPISAEVLATDTKTMIKEGKKLHRLHKNVVVKVPLTFDGLAACRQLSNAGIKTNVTLCFSPGQALLAAKAHATYISPFVGRLDDKDMNGTGVVKTILKIYAAHNFNTQVLVASIRGIRHVIESAAMGAHVVTVPPKILRELIHHELTDVGLEAFLKDVEESKQTI